MQLVWNCIVYVNNVLFNTFYCVVHTSVCVICVIHTSKYLNYSLVLGFPQWITVIFLVLKFSLVLLTYIDFQSIISSCFYQPVKYIFKSFFFLCQYYQLIFHQWLCHLFWSLKILPMPSFMMLHMQGDKNHASFYLHSTCLSMI